MSLNPQSYQLPGNRIAYFFSDAAGANACLAMYEMNTQAGKEGSLYSNRKNIQEKHAARVKNQIPVPLAGKADCVFTGTSHPESSDEFEIKAIRQAKSERIWTISFIDHWINFALRFQGLTEDELPDEIWVVDENARKKAVDEGLPAPLLRVKGNPYHYYLSEIWKSSYKGKSYLEHIGIPSTGFHLLYAPDPFSIRDLYKKTGFTEYEALQDIFNIIAPIEDWHLIIKQHPLQPAETFEKFAAGFPGQISLLRDADVPELVHAVDLVVGFYSNLLLEANAMGKTVIRYFPGQKGADLLKDSAVMSAACADPGELKNKIHSFIYG